MGDLTVDTKRKALGTVCTHKSVTTDPETIQKPRAIYPDMGLQLQTMRTGMEYVIIKHNEIINNGSRN